MPGLLSLSSICGTHLKETKPREYAVRFLFGGLSTIVAGLVANHYGPA